MNCQHCNSIIVDDKAYEGLTEWRKMEWDAMKKMHEKECPQNKEKKE